MDVFSLLFFLTAVTSAAEKMGKGRFKIADTVGINGDGRYKVTDKQTEVWLHLVIKGSAMGQPTADYKDSSEEIFVQRSNEPRRPNYPWLYRNAKLDPSGVCKYSIRGSDMKVELNVKLSSGGGQCPRPPSTVTQPTRPSPSSVPEKPPKAPEQPPEEAIGPGATPIKVPSAQPIERPVAPPIGRPGAPPTKFPWAPPEKVPGAQPIERPGAPPTKGPGVPPTKGPGVPPTKGPGAEPKKGPGAPPTKGPGVPPTKGPGVPPTKGTKFTEPSAVPGQAGPENSKFQQDGLAAHNKYRTRHNAQPLRLNSGMSQEALKWAKYLGDNDKFEHSESEDGENIASSCGSGPKETGDRVTFRWYDEVCDPGHNFRANRMDYGTGHFTQVVWKDTKELGIAYYDYIDKKKRPCRVTVARYRPPGNYGGRFLDNVDTGSFNKQAHCKTNDLEMNRQLPWEPR